MNIPVQHEKPRWPYKHRMTSVAEFKNDPNTITVRVYTKKTPIAGFLTAIFVIFCLFSLLSLVGLFLFLDSISTSLQP